MYEVIKCVSNTYFNQKGTKLLSDSINLSVNPHACLYILRLMVTMSSPLFKTYGSNFIFLMFLN